MPIYEYLCRACNRIYSFHAFSASVTAERDPRCPRCAAEDLQRVPSSFGIRASAKSAGGGGDQDEAGMEAEMMRLASRLEGMDENDPRQMAQAVRQMAEIAGEPVTPAMEEMIRRLEAGEDPETVEEELGDLLEDELGGLDGDGEGDARSGSFTASPPTKDEGLYPY